MDYTQFLDIAIIAAKKAADVHLSYFHKQLDITFKDSHYNMVTKADIEAEEVITSIINEKFPGHNILAEENKYEQTDSPFTWIIDPLDGTNNFTHGIPVFSVSIALAQKVKESADPESPILITGVVYDPISGELYHACRDSGSYLNNKPITVSRASSLRESILSTGFYYNRGKEMDMTLKHIRDFYTQGMIDIRRMGSAALDLCYVACGRLDGYWEHYLNPWDFAAGILILDQAGGKTTNRNGEPMPIAPSYIVASNGKIHRDMLAIVEKD